MSDQEVVKSHCNDCLQETRHFLLFTKTQDFTQLDPDGGPHYIEQFRWSLLECCGCESISLKREYTHSSLEEPEVDFFPPSASRKIPRWAMLTLCFKQGGAIYGLLQEVYSSLHAGHYRLAAMGTRALIEAVLMDALKNEDQGFPEKLDMVQERGLLSRQDRQILEAAIEAGHGAAHRAYAPRAEDVNKIIDIVEHLLESLYVLGPVGEKLKSTVPPRKGKSRGTIEGSAK
jgi:hypothetical protein